MVTLLHNVANKNDGKANSKRKQKPPWILHIPRWFLLLRFGAVLLLSFGDGKEHRQQLFLRRLAPICADKEEKQGTRYATSYLM